eukprot:TRINITY_DN38092_c0_g1_i1.p2 TRINITY_DN38092_c0_g1~~TRINITY_DN38092_c0_g1_i1.p2  ORF type:complete len:100 (-),score=8.09 TRINITY_DN38092_c0_g1_i1:98-361(-)
MVSLKNAMKRKRVNKAVEKSANSLPGTSPLPSLLIAPIQRIPRYILLMSTLVQNTPKDHPDYRPSKNALQLLKRLAQLVDRNTGPVL